MSITLENAQKILNALIEAQACDPLTQVGSFSIEGRTVSYRSADDLITLINYYSRLVANLQRVAAGAPRTSFVLPNFNGRCR